MTTPYDVPANLLIERLAEHIKKSYDDVTPPAWSLWAKTGSHKERPPDDADWWYYRCASLLRKLYLHGSVGVSRLRTEYGGRRRKGRRREHARKAGGSAIRKPLQQLEKAGLVKIVKGEGRKLTAEGVSVLDRLSSKIAGELRRAKEVG